MRCAPPVAARAGEAGQQLRIDDAARVVGQRKQADQDVRAGEEWRETLLASEDFDPFQRRRRPRRAAPAGDVEADHAQLARGILPQHAHPHDADANVGGGGLVAVVLPEPFGLLADIAHLLSQDFQAMQDDVFAHPAGEVGVDHAHDGHVGQAIVAHQVIDAGAQREDRRKIWQARERAGRMLP